MIGLKTKNNLISEDTQQNKDNIQINSSIPQHYSL